MSKKLTEKEELFAKAYVANNFNAAKAHRIAYAESSTASARTNAGRVRDKAHVRARIDELIEAELGDLDTLAKKTLYKLFTIAFSEREDEHYNAQAQLKALDLIQKQLGTNIQKVQAEVKGETEVVINILGDTDEDADDET